MEADKALVKSLNSINKGEIGGGIKLGFGINIHYDVYTTNKTDDQWGPTQYSIGNCTQYCVITYKGK